MYRQFDLRCDDARMTCWLKEEPGLRRGALVTLKGLDDRHWEVVRVSQMTLESPPDMRWKVGGLL
jgi:hypothetical protein